MINLSTRIQLFAICTSIESDIKEFIKKSTGNIGFTQNMLAKAYQRRKDLSSDDHAGILDQLDLQDYVDLIVENPHQYGINNEKAKLLRMFFQKIIPIRNRVMHTKPLELGDRSVLMEILECIQNDISWMEWKNTAYTEKMLRENPSALVENKSKSIPEYNPKVYHNLPMPEFDDTGFIGRESDIKEIKELILNRKNQIITVVGNGGIGKTAIVVKTLYDLMDDENCDYECILWITLKTKTLAGGEFVEITDHISSLNEIYNFVQPLLISDNQGDSRENLLKFMEDFKTLLVLDNLETLNLNEINDFLDSIPERSKVLITSRHGIGELEKRKRLDGLEKKDSIMYFRELSKYYGLDVHKRGDEEIYNIAGKQLYSNPLSIKWYMNGIYSGMSETQLLAHKDDIINFCVSNIYDKLSPVSHKILQVFLLEKRNLSYGAIDFYLDTDEVEIREAINQLLSTYMVSPAKGEFNINEMSREYIALNYPPNNEMIANITQKRKQLKIMLQEVKARTEREPFNPKAINADMKSEDKELATYYLQKALEESRNKNWDEANRYTGKAANICPNFYEIYKIKAFISAEHNELFNAIENYQIALQKCKSDKEKAIVYYFFSKFYSVKMQNLDYALEYIEYADQLMPNCVEILLEKARVYIFVGKYDSAEVIIKRVETLESVSTARTENVMASVYAELYRRKAEGFSKRDIEQKLQLYKKAIERFNSVSAVDIKSGLCLLNVLVDLSYNLIDEESIELFISTINRYSILLSSIKGPKKQKLCEQMENLKLYISEEDYERVNFLLVNKIMNYDDLDDSCEGIVSSLKERYGFISNNTYQGSNDIYFARTNAYSNIQIGDVVHFRLLKTAKGMAATNVIRK